MHLNLQGLLWLLPWISTLLVSAGISCEMTDLLAGAEMQGASVTENRAPVVMDPPLGQMLRPDQNSPCTFVNVVCGPSWSGGLALGTLQVAGSCAGCVETFVNVGNRDRLQPSTPETASRENNAASSSAAQLRGQDRHVDVLAPFRVSLLVALAPWLWQYAVPPSAAHRTRKRRPVCTPQSGALMAALLLMVQERNRGSVPAEALNTCETV
jgi:hypothetical protein